LRVLAISFCAVLALVPLSSAQTATPAKPATAPAAKSAAAPAAKVSTAKPAAKTAPTKPVSKPAITISGVCPAGAADKKAFSPTCQTVITQADLESLINALNPDMPAAVRRNLGGSLGQWTAFAAKAHELGIDKSAEFAEMVRFARTQLLYQVMDRQMRKQAEDISPAQLQSYYDGNKEKFEEYNLVRVIVPREPTSKDKPVDEAAEKLFAQQIRDRLAKGEEAKALQTEAFKHAGQNAQEPPVEVNQRKRGALPASQAKVFDLKPGEVSDVLPDPGAFFIYKVVSRDLPALDKATLEVKKTLAGERYKASMEEINSHFKVNLEESYFGPSPQAPPPGAPSMRAPGTQGGMPVHPAPPAHVAPPTPQAPAQPAAAPQPPTGTVPK